MSYQMCKCCVMDTTDREITFDENGICNHCQNAKKMLKKIEENKKNFNLEDFINKVKIDGMGKKYDCIVGISGGVDSCYVMHLVKKFGLRPLAVHFDNGWDSELSVQNIKNLLEKLEIDLYTYVVDWQEFRDIQLAFLKASTPDSEIPTDHMILPVMGTVAHKYKCKYVFMGHNSSSESILPRTWSHGHNDWRYVKNIYKKFGTGKFKTFPYFNRADLAYFMRKFVWFDILDYVDYDKEKAKRLLQDKYDWRDYGGKHYESFYTKFYQSYILPVKFGFDKRKMHLSSLIVAGQLSREDALKMLECPPYDEQNIEREIEYFLEKMQISREEYDSIMKAKPLSYWDYPNNENSLTGKLVRIILEKFGGDRE